MSSRRLFGLVCLLLLCVPARAAQPSTTPPPALPGRALLPDRFDLRATLKRTIDVSRPIDGQVVILENSEDIALQSPLDQEVTIPKRALLYGRYYVQGNTLSLRVERALWNGGSVPLNAYLIAPVPLNVPASQPAGYSTAPPRLLGISADASFGSRLTLAAQQQELPAGTPLALRHLDRDYKPQAVLSEIDSTWDDVAVARRLAPTGDARSELVLGLAYMQDQLLRRDPVKAAFWFLRAAEQGLPAAQNDIAVLYADGQGVARDDVAAHMWFELSIEGGRERDRSALEILERRMSPAQIADATQRAAAWRQAHPQRH
jgi:hypothetical protein